MTRLATKMLLLGALAGLAAGAAGASAANSEPSKVVTFSPAMLDTDSGARAVYHRSRRRPNKSVRM